MAKEKKAEQAKPSKKPAAKKQTRHATFKELTEKKRKAAPKNTGLPVEIPEVKPNPGGRPSSFEEAAPKIIAYVRKGNTYNCAAGCARISYRTMNNWMNLGKEAEENEDYDSKYFQFLHDIRAAEKEAEQEVVNLWKTELPGNWVACRDFLARRFSDDWSAKDKVDLTSNGETVGKPIFLPLKKNAETEEE